MSENVKYTDGSRKEQDERGKANATAEFKDAGTSVTRMDVNGCEVGRKTLCAEPKGSPCGCIVLALCEEKTVRVEMIIEGWDMFCVVSGESHWRPSAIL